MVIVLLGVLAVFAAPRMFAASDFTARGFQDETKSLLRFAQKAAIAQRRTVCVTLNSTGVTLTMFATNPETGSCASAPVLSPPNKLRGGSGLAGTPSTFRFTPLGSTDQSSPVAITITTGTAVANIMVEAQTGYVHD